MFKSILPEYQDHPAGTHDQLGDLLKHQQKVKVHHVAS